MAELFENRVERLAPGEQQPDAPVAGQLPGTGQDKVSRSCESHESLGPPAQRHPEPRHLGKAPGDQRSPRVQAEAQAVADTGGDRHHVFHRSADLDAREVGAEIDPEHRLVQFAREALRERSVPRGERERSGKSLRHFQREARTGQGPARGACSEHLGRDLMRELAACLLEALACPDQGPLQP